MLSSQPTAGPPDTHRGQPPPLEEQVFTMDELSLALSFVQGGWAHGHIPYNEQEVRRETNIQADREMSTVYMLATLITRILTLQRREPSSASGIPSNDGDSGLTVRQLVEAVRDSLGLLLEDPPQLSEGSGRTHVNSTLEPPSLVDTRQPMPLSSSGQPPAYIDVERSMLDRFTQSPPPGRDKGKHVEQDRFYDASDYVHVPVSSLSQPSTSAIAGTPPSTPVESSTSLPVHQPLANAVAAPVVPAIPVAPPAPVTSIAPAATVVPAASVGPAGVTVPTGVVAPTAAATMPALTQQLQNLGVQQAQAQRYYVVFSGTRTGVFDDWGIASAYVTGVSCAYSKKYKTRTAAQHAYNLALALGYVKVIPP